MSPFTKTKDPLAEAVIKVALTEVIVRLTEVTRVEVYTRPPLRAVTEVI